METTDIALEPLDGNILKIVRRIELMTRRSVNAELAGRYHSVFKGQGMAFSEVRPYAIGDDVRHIDWNVSARHLDQGLFVKQFVEERELTILLMVDLSGSTHFGTRGRQKRQRLAEIGALLAFSALQNNDRVGLVLFTEEVEFFLPPRKGKRHGLRVIREIIEARPKLRRTRIASAFRFLSRAQKRRAICFVLSDWLDEGWERALKVAQARHDVVAVRVLDPAERVLPDLGLLRVVDAETGEVCLVDSRDASVKNAYKKRQEVAHKETKRKLVRLGADVIDLATDEDMVTPLVSFFRTRAARLSGA